MEPANPTPPRVFLDSSVFFAATYSNTGSAHDLLIAAVQGRVSLVLSRYVLQETERNILTSAPRHHATFLRFRDDVPYHLSHPSRQLVEDTALVVAPKDAPIIAAARAAHATLVATFDRKDLLSKREEIRDAFRVTVATPGEILTGLEDSPGAHRR
jgi:predicted nucleic acid-binding protein